MSMRRTIKIRAGEKYKNRSGVYKVLAIQGEHLLAEYEDGRQQKLTIKLQERIARHIQDESKVRAKEKKRRQSQLQPQNDIYRNRCWSCYKKISSEKNKRCSTCGWYICACRACGCNRPKDSGPTNLYASTRKKP